MPSQDAIFESKPIFHVGEHIISKDGMHGIIRSVNKNFQGWVYCINRKDWIGVACINERDCKLYEKDKIK